MIAIQFLPAIQRSHDMNVTGWLSLILLVPFGPFVFVLAPGTRGENQYGKQPPPNSVGVILLACLLPLFFVSGILAAIAIPAYQDYTIRAQVTEGLSLAAGPEGSRRGGLRAHAGGAGGSSRGRLAGGSDGYVRPIRHEGRRRSRHDSRDVRQQCQFDDREHGPRTAAVRRGRERRMAVWPRAGTARSRCDGGERGEVRRPHQHRSALLALRVSAVI